MIHVEISKVKDLVRLGLGYSSIAEQLEISCSTLYRGLKSQNSSINLLKKELDSPQNRAWVTIRKNKAMEVYQLSTSSGIKASVSRKFRKDYGLDIKSEIARLELFVKAVPKIEVPKVEKIRSIKETFAKKEVELMIPKKLQSIIDEQNRRITALEKMLKK